jgi:hypothetical protein
MLGFGAPAMPGGSSLQRFDNVLRNVSDEELGHGGLDMMLADDSIWGRNVQAQCRGWRSRGGEIRYLASGERVSGLPGSRRSFLPLLSGEGFCCDRDLIWMRSR